ncbi:MAG: ABC transporter permease subunit, partial [Candidatus Marinimicrobia bacterium]|nr:ABC transporter permease subunit [Candidatus Neomarinimicrobiota bacterium]
MRTFTIFRKELKDTMRDRRTILMMIVMPLVLVPLLISVVTKIQQSQIEKAEERTLSIAFVGKEFAPELYVLCEENEQFILFPDIPEDSLLAMTKRGELD